MRTQAPAPERESAALQPSSHDVERLRATAERIDDLLTDAKSALDRLMTTAVAQGRAAAPPPHEDRAASSSAVAELLLEDPVPRSTRNEFELPDLEEFASGTVAEQHPAKGPIADEPVAAEPLAAAEAPGALAHHDAPPSPRAEARGVFALAMVSLSVLIAAALLGQHYAGLGIVGGANLLAWLVVVQQRREAGTPASAH
jgi:hypothetical protein